MPMDQNDVRANMTATRMVFMLQKFMPADKVQEARNAMYQLALSEGFALLTKDEIDALGEPR